VLRKSPCPVLTVGPQVGNSEGAPRRQGPIVFATDFDFTTMDAIRYAACFSHRCGGPLHCLHVLPRTLAGGGQSDVVPEIMGEALQQLAAESGVTIEPPVCATTYGSEVSHAVVEYARRQRARLIVLGVRQASLLASHVPEHIAYRIITEAPCPVLTQAFARRHHASALTAACL
jgi:nucleotide-binding universal stress UspA family protein